jgi:hypothetical protein
MGVRCFGVIQTNSLDKSERGNTQQQAPALLGKANDTARDASTGVSFDV